MQQFYSKQTSSEHNEQTEKSKEVIQQTIVTLINSPPWGLELLKEQGLQPSLGGPCSGAKIVVEKRLDFGKKNN